MSLADELLENLPENPLKVSEADSYFTIDPVTRTMSNGSGVKNVIMQGDHDSVTYVFELPRIIDGHDMLQCNRVITHWNNVGTRTSEENEETEEVAESTDIIDLRINPYDDSTVICSWTISRNSTQLAGILSFLVEYKRVEGEETIYEWHTDIYSNVEIRSGRNNGAQSVMAYTDIIEQWRNRLFSAGNSVMSDITAAGEDQKDEIEAKGRATLATIPDDYTTTHNLAKSATRTRANAITVTAEGESIVVEDSSDDYLRGLHVYGRTTQIMTTGAQLAWPNINVENYPYLGVVCSKTGDGNILLHGTATSNLWNRLASATLVAGETYTLSAHKDISLSVWDVTADGSFAVKNAGKESITFIAPNTGNYSFCIENVVDTPFPYIRADIMLNIGSAALPWESYSNGVASPSIAFPQELNSITDPLMGLYGKNLFDVDELVLASNKSITISPDKYTVTVVGGSDKTYAYSHYDMPYELTQLLRGRKLRLSSDSVSKSVSSAYSPVQLNIKCADGTFQYPVNHDTKLYHEFTLPDDTVEIRFGIYTNNSSTLLESDNTVVVAGVRLTLAEHNEYEPYKGYQTITLDRTIHGLPVKSGGNYTDENGQQWICDEIDLERGVYVQRIIEFVADDTLAYEKSTKTNPNGNVYFTLINKSHDALLSNDYTSLCDNRIIRKELAELELNDARIAVNSVGSHMCIWFCSDVNTVEEMKESMGNCESKFLLPITTPIETPLTAEEITAFEALRTNYPNTTILNDAGAWMSVKYNADTKTYVENPKTLKLVDSSTGVVYELKVVNGSITVNPIA